MKALSIDFETRSEVDLRYSGVYRYAEDPSTDVLCMAYSLWDDTGFEAFTPELAPVELWLPGDPVPDALRFALENDFELRAWNAQFERVVWQIMHGRYGFPELTSRLDLWHCTEAEAYAMNLPGSLDMSAKVLNLEHKKDEEGHRIMLQLCKPRQPRLAQGESKDEVYYWEDPEKYAKLYSYCKQDVRVEIEAAGRLQRLTPAERHVYMLDQQINDRGIAVDLDLVQALKDMSDEAIARANAELAELTGGTITKVTQRARIQKYIDSVELDDMQKGTIAELLEGDDLSGLDRRILELRAEAGKASIGKLDAILRCVCADGRVRGLLQYHAAGTGRWGGRLVQPQNIARPTVGCADDCSSKQPPRCGWCGQLWHEIEDHAEPCAEDGGQFIGPHQEERGECDCGGAERFIPLVLRRDYDKIEAVEPVMEVAVSLLRSCFIAAPGHRFLSADYSAIEGHVVAWLAGQDAMMSYFEMAALIHHRITGEVVSPDSIEKGTMAYHVGKTAVLGCGFGMGGERYQGTVKEWTGVEIDRELADAAVYEIWRPANPEIVLLWAELESAAKRAVRNPGEIVPAGRGGCLRYVVRGQFLWCILPSGRPLAYAMPQIERDEQGREKLSCSSPNVFYRKADGTWGKKRWGRRSLYGGLLTENAVQALARDIMAGGMLRAEMAGNPIVLTVHDEILSEVPVGTSSLEEFEHCMTQKASWAQTIPVSVGGWEGQRYRKD